MRLPAVPFPTQAVLVPVGLRVGDAAERDIEVGRVRIEFHVSIRIGGAATQKMRTETGTMFVSTPETTAFDLARFPAASGHWSNIATALSELLRTGLDVDPQRRQSDMFGSVNELPPKRKQRLEKSWAGAFYHGFFCRIDEGVFAELYSDEPSRPDIPADVLVGFEVLKAGQRWSDEQAHDAVRFDLQVRHALGMRRLSEDVIAL